MGNGERPRAPILGLVLNSFSVARRKDMSSTEASRPVGVALIGSGRMGAYHGATLAQRPRGARLGAVADPAPGAAESLAAALGRVRHTPIQLRPLQTPGWRRW